jgi:hypothetical protein
MFPTYTNPTASYIDSDSICGDRRFPSPDNCIAAMLTLVSRCMCEFVRLVTRYAETRRDSELTQTGYSSD